jgi:glycosyltransferase involved in cell wall biosynthesis
MEEKILSGKKNGMAVMLLTILFYLVAVAGAVLGGLMMDEGMVLGLILFVVCVAYLCLGWIVIPGLKVLLAGNGPTEDALRALIAELRLENTAKLLGYRTDLQDIVPAVDLVVSCSRREGLGLNLIEAMLCRRPIVAAENRGHRELVADGVNGFLFAPGDMDTLAEHIHAIYSDPALAGRMGHSGFERARCYTVDAVAERLIPILLEEALP